MSTNLSLVSAGYCVAERQSQAEVSQLAQGTKLTRAELR